MMVPAAFDLETHLIRPGLLAPRLVCLSWADTQGYLLDRPTGLRWLRHALMRPSLLVIGHNLTYDLGVAVAEEPGLLPLVFDGYRDGRLRCTLVKQQLLDVALGMRKFRRVDGVVTRATYGLDDLVKLYFGRHLEKTDTWRLRYALLDGVPVEEWPADAREYAISDAVEALNVHHAQEKEIVDCFGDEGLPNQAEQQQAAWALHLMSMWGVRADAPAVDRFVATCEQHIEKMKSDLEGTGIFKPNGSRTMAEIRRRVVESLTRLQIDVPMTDPSEKFPEGQVVTDKDTLQLTDDPALHVLAESMTYAKHLEQWGPVLRAAVLRPVCARYNVLVDTGRTSCGGSEGQEATNFQNPPRKGDVRPAIIPRKGWLFCSTDADTIELRAHAQNCLELVGWSRMAEYLQRQHQEHGPDLHVVLGAGIMGISPEEAHERMQAGDKEVEDARQFAKIPNFGFPGGLGAATFVGFAAAQMSKDDFAKWLGANRDAAESKARQLRETWFQTFPENREYFAKVGAMIDRHKGYGTVRQLMSRRIRGECRFTAAANGFFQGRVADAMKEILFRLADECYTGRMPDGSRSVLWGSRPVMFLHDEPIVEHPEDGTESDRAQRQQDIVVEVLNRWMPDIPCTSTAVLMRRWYKGSKPLRVNGKLVPTRPEKIVGADGKVKIKWVHDAA